MQMWTASIPMRDTSLARGDERNKLFVNPFHSIDAICSGPLGMAIGTNVHAPVPDR